MAENGALPFAVVSDGCSTSGRTDIGARLWCLSACPLHYFSATAHDYAYLLRPIMADIAHRLCLKDADLDATLGMAFGLKGGFSRTLLFGDGIMAAATQRGIEIVRVEWAGNMPGYPSYELNGHRLAEFLAQSEVIARSEEVAPCRVIRTTITADGKESTWEDGYSAAIGLRGIQANWSIDADVIAVMTDGGSQVSGLDLQTVVTELLSIGPARQGAFAKRKLNGALKRWAKDSHRPIDDIAIAALVRVPDDV